jgi:hypothetical protein
MLKQTDCGVHLFSKNWDNYAQSKFDCSYGFYDMVTPKQGVSFIAMVCLALLYIFCPSTYEDFNYLSFTPPRFMHLD